MSDLLEGSDIEENYSDISLDEADEELVWRVFYKAHDSINTRKDGHTNADYEEEFTDDSSEYNDENDELSDLSDVDDPVLVAKYKELKKVKYDKNLTEEEKKRLLIANFSDEQMERFEAYRRMTVNKPGIKKVCNSILGHSIPQNIAIVLAGISKLFLGEIITKAIEIKEREAKSKLILEIDAKKKQKRHIMNSLEKGEEVEVEDKKLNYDGDIKPLDPNHIREAWRLYKLENSSAFAAQWRRQGDSDGMMFR